MAAMRYIPNVTTLSLDAEKCTGCGMCVDVCPHAVFAMEDSKVKITDRDACMECGACALNCAAGAVTVDAGVGCAAAVLNGLIRGTEPSCDCSKEKGGNSCC